MVNSVSAVGVRKEEAAEGRFRTDVYHPLLFQFQKSTLPCLNILNG